MVYSKRLLHKDPDPEELMNIALQLDKVSTTSEYLCPVSLVLKPKSLSSLAKCLSFFLKALESFSKTLGF